VKLKHVETSHDLRAKVKLGLVTVMNRARAPDLMRLLLHRPELFGRGYSRWTQRVMRGPSLWSVGERELMASFVSEANGCAFCYGAHWPIARRALRVDAPGWRDASISRELQATLGLLEKLVRAPGSVTPSDVDTVRAVGVADEAIEQAVHVCAIFCVMNRLANALDFELPSPAAFERMAGPLLRFGYELR
jgi:uncharacterized peroxidase-related enzyme